jgi:2,3-dihydroxy-2,3-dihydro-p-cumate dehydrogenase
MTRFKGQTVIVTGAAHGIGEAIAQQFAAEGADLVLADLDEARLASAAENLEHEHNASVVTTGGDLSTEPAAQTMVDTARATFGRIDVLINNAGGGVLSPTLKHTEETLQATMNRNLWSALRCTLATIPAMTDAGYGRVVYLGADSSRTGLDLHAVYNLAKGGLHGFAGALTREFGPHGVTFNVVSPTAVNTPEFRASRKAHPDIVGRLLDTIPLGRPAEMAEVVTAVAFLASPEAAFISGQVLSVNGGATLG